MNKLVAFLTVASLVVTTLAPAALAQDRELIDRVIAVVEDEAVFQSDIDQTIKQFMVSQGRSLITDEERTELEDRALDELINSKLILAQAKRMGIEISFTDVERAVEQAIDENRQTLGGDAAFQSQLAREGLTIDGLKQLYREQVRNRMLVERVLATEINRGSLQVTDEEVRDAWEDQKSELGMRPAVAHLRTIFFAMNSSTDAQTVALDTANDLRDRIINGEDFASVAEEFSQDPASAKNGGALGTLKLEDLSEQSFADAAAALSIGEISQPVFTQFGYHLIQVTGKNDADGEVDIRHILVRVTTGENDVQAVFARATGVHEQIDDGMPFEDAAKEYSDDPATAANGGDLGWLREEELPDFFQDVLDDMRPGDVSQVLREPAGFRIVQLVQRETERPYEYYEVKDDMKKMVEQERMAESYDSYLTSLRDEFYIQIVE